MRPAETLAAWSRRFLTSLHHDTTLHRLGLLIGVGEEVRFWPFPDLPSLDDLALFLEAELQEVQALNPEVVALVLPMDASDLGSFEAERDYEVMVIVVDAHRHCSTLLGAVADDAALGWRDLTASSGYLPRLAPLLFGAFSELHPLRPDDDTEWALVEAQTHTEEDLEELVGACAADLARRRGGLPQRELEGALLARPHGEEWQAIEREAERLSRVYRGYLQELRPPFVTLSDLEEPVVAQLFFAGLVELARRDTLSAERLRQRLGAQVSGKGGEDFKEPASLSRTVGD